MKKFIGIIVLGSIVLFFMPSYSLEAASFSVPSRECPTIQKAISLARDGDTVTVFPGIYRENLVIDGKSINLQGKNRERTILDGGNRAPCIILKNGSNGRIQGLTIQHGNARGNAGEGGGIACYQSNPAIQDNIFKNNVADKGLGGAIFCFKSSPVIKNNDFYQNRADYGEGGALYVFRSTPTLVNNNFTENQALSGEGGAVSLIESQGTVQNNAVLGNRANSGKDIHTYWKE
ncbi:MAG: hypothetical protein AB1611_04010 [bacterium]